MLKNFTFCREEAFFLDTVDERIMRLLIIDFQMLKTSELTPRRI